MADGWMDNLFTSPTDKGGIGAVDAYGKNMAAGMAQGALGAGSFGHSSMASYVNDYLPYDKKFMSHVDSIGTDGYRAQQRGLAMTNVQMQNDAQRKTTERQMAAMGVDPSSSRFAAVQGGLASQAALNKVSAASAADRAARDEWVKGIGTINAMGAKTAELGLKGADAAAKYGQVGLAAADLGAAALDRGTQANASMASASAAGANAAAAGQNAATAAKRAEYDYEIGLKNAGTNAEQIGNNYQLGLGRLALDRYNIDNTTALNRQSNSLGSQVGSALAGYGTRYAVDAMGNYFKNLGNSPGVSVDTYNVIPSSSFSGGQMSNDDIAMLWE